VTAAPFLQYVPGIMSFVQTFYRDDQHTMAYLSSSLGLIGDIGEAFGAQAKDAVAQEFVQEMIREGRDKRMAKSVRNNATYAQKVRETSLSFIRSLDFFVPRLLARRYSLHQSYGEGDTKLQVIASLVK
jgi:hypothetical protein